MDKLVDSQKSLCLNAPFQEMWLYLLQTAEFRSTTQTLKNTCPSEITSATGKSSSSRTIPLLGAVSTSKIGTCAGKSMRTGRGNALSRPE